MIPRDTLRPVFIEAFPPTMDAGVLYIPIPLQPLLLVRMRP